MPSKSINDLSIVSAVDSTNAYIIVETSAGTKRISVDALINSSNAVDTKPTTGQGSFDSVNGGTIPLTDVFATSSSTTVTLIKESNQQYGETSITLFKPAGSTTIYGPSGTFTVGSEATMNLGTRFVKRSGRGTSSGERDAPIKIVTNKDAFSILSNKNSWGQNTGTYEKILVIIQAFK
jgi:hypothetical protein